MIAALIVAAAVAGQLGGEAVPQVGIDYAPKANDRALLGNWNEAIPSDTIARASCYSSMERTKLAIAAKDESEEGGGLSARPDAYTPIAGTSVVVKEIVIVETTSFAQTTRMPVAKIRILEGEFKGKELLTAAHNVFRYAGDAGAPPEAKATPKKRPAGRGASAPVPSDAKLVLTDLVVDPMSTGNYVNVDGRFRFTSNTALKYVQATVSFEDREGKLVRSESVFCTPQELAPGDIGSFTVMAQKDVRYARVKLSFKDTQRNIPWFDQSGANAHQ